MFLRCKRGYELLKSKKQLDKALKSFKNALKLNPRSEDALIGAGMVYVLVCFKTSSYRKTKCNLEFCVSFIWFSLNSMHV